MTDHGKNNPTFAIFSLHPSPSAVISANGVRQCDNTDALLTKAPRWEAQWLSNSLTNSGFTVHYSKSTEHFTLLFFTSTSLRTPACSPLSKWESCAGMCESFNPKSRTMSQTRCTALKTKRCIAGRKSELQGSGISEGNNRNNNVSTRPIV